MPADNRRLHIFGSAERRRARLHVDVGREAAVDEGSPWTRDLRHDETRKRLGVLLGERARERDRRHRAGKRERRHDHDLVAPRHLDHALEHGRIESERRGGIDHREQRGLALQRFIVDSARNSDHLDRVQIALAPKAISVDGLVRQRQHVE